MREKGFIHSDADKKRLEKAKKVKEKKDKEATEAFVEKKRKKIKTSEALSHLKDLIRDGDITQSTMNFVHEITEDGILDSAEVKLILEKIDEIQNNKDVSRFLPEEMIITREEYLQAFQNEEKRQEALAKVEDALGHLALHMSNWGKIGFNLFAWLSLILSKNLVMIQEGHIDIKRSLKK